jgi:hypothetical protein
VRLPESVVQEAEAGQLAMPISCRCSMALAWVGLLACSPRSSSMVDLQLDVDQAFDQPPSAIATRGFIHAPMQSASLD